ncbi:MAG: hypothetical protein DMD79_21255 [Candidatus Rokuibacteriota bacterium]|nr:MAG: hypothetical protein DMD79_21255 [Candidatus Rokubacteria bacterium]
MTEPLQPVSEGGGVPRIQARPRLPELAGFPGITPNTVARAIEDLNRSGYRPLSPPGSAPLSTLSVSIATRGALPAEPVKGRVIPGNPVEEAES